MTPEQLAYLKKTITITSAYYGRQLPDPAVVMYAEDMEDLPFEKVMEAIKVYRRNPANRQMFLPAHIREIVFPTGRPEDFAREAANRVVAAVAKFGWIGAHEARAWVGELGWRAVERLGGWMQLCEHLGTPAMPLTTVQAQVRDACLATLRLGEIGIYDQPVALPEAKSTVEELQAAGEILKSLPQPKKLEDTK